jgi:hypothetical protein
MYIRPNTLKVGKIELFAWLELGISTWRERDASDARIAAGPNVRRTAA